MPATISTTTDSEPGLRNLVRRHPAVAYFLCTYVISWGAAGLVAAPHLLRRESLPVLTGILMFPAMLLGPGLTGIGLTAWLEGRAGVRALFRRMVHYRLAGRWYAVLLLPPALILLVLFVLRWLVSPVFTPNLFIWGMLFGIPAGLLEEIGWIGFAYPHMSSRYPRAAALGLGLLWSAWHIPVVSFLGAAVPHRNFWLAYFLAFAAAMTAMRVLICWLYRHTQSLGLAQLLHISSTGSLVVFSAPRVTPGQEAFWYAIYALALWLVLTAAIFRKPWPSAKT